jgi:hypothetical protein
LSKEQVRTKVILIIAAIILAVPLNATTVQRLSFDDLVSKAETIIVGHVLDSQSSWTKDGKLILTQTTVEVQEQLKGTPPRLVTVTTVGGKVGTSILHVSGMPAFERNETAVIFLERSGSYSTVLGLNQGKFSVANGEVANSISGLSFNDAATSRPMRMPLDEFKRQIQQRLRR